MGLLYLPSWHKCPHFCSIYHRTQCFHYQQWSKLKTNKWCWYLKNNNYIANLWYLPQSALPPVKSASCSCAVVQMFVWFKYSFMRIVLMLSLIIWGTLRSAPLWIGDLFHYIHHNFSNSFSSWMVWWRCCTCEFPLGKDNWTVLWSTVRHRCFYYAYFES